MADSRMSEQTNEIDTTVTELRLLDPGHEDGLYWARFHRSVLDRAADELRRRREAVHVTVADALSGWARMVVPVAAMAAALAGVSLTQSEQAQNDRVVVEDILDDRPSLPEALEAEFAISVATVASSRDNF